jgi:hypothetical protein
MFVLYIDLIVAQRLNHCHCVLPDLHSNHYTDVSRKREMDLKHTDAVSQEFDILWNG